MTIDNKNGLKIKTVEMDRLTVEQFKEAQKLPLVVVLDDVRSLYNVGAVFRSADAFLLEGVYLCGITACPPHQEIHKTALGAEDSVDWRHFDRTEDAVVALQQQGYHVYAIEQVHGSTMLQQFGAELQRHAAGASAPKGYAVVLGNEVKGVKQIVVDMADGCLEIPQWGTKHSLNVSTTAGIVMWEMVRAMRALE